MQLTKLDFTSAKRTSRRLDSMLSASKRSKVLSDSDIKCSETVTIIHNDHNDILEDEIDTEVLASWPWG